MSEVLSSFGIGTMFYYLLCGAEGDSKVLACRIATPALFFLAAAVTKYLGY